MSTLTHPFLFIRWKLSLCRDRGGAEDSRKFLPTIVVEILIDSHARTQQRRMQQVAAHALEPPMTNGRTPIQIALFFMSDMLVILSNVDRSERNKMPRGGCGDVSSGLTSGCSFFRRLKFMETNICNKIILHQNRLILSVKPRQIRPIPSNLPAHQMAAICNGARLGFAVRSSMGWKQPLEDFGEEFD